jgi:hypothetical protein
MQYKREQEIRRTPPVVLGLLDSQKTSQLQNLKLQKTISFQAPAGGFGYALY